MTDLENLWDDYPTGKAPVASILAAAAGEQRRRRRLFVRPLLTAGVVTGLAGAFVAGTLVDGGSGPGTPGGIQALPQRVAFQADLEPATSCDDLLATYRERGKKLVSAWGWGGGPYYDDYAHLQNADVPLGATLDSVRGRAPFPPLDTQSRALEKSANPRTNRVTNSDTGTNVQEAGVDEPDSVKTDGKILVTVRDDDLVTYDVTGSSTAKLSSIPLTGIEDAEILLSGDTVVAVGRDDETEADDPGTRVLTISLATPAEPEVTDDVTYDAGLMSARQHGEAVRLVLESGLPQLDFAEPRGKVTEREALKKNRELVSKTTIEDWLPSVTADGDSKQLLDCTNVAIPSDDLLLDTTSIVGFDAGSPTKLDAIGLAGHTGIAYESGDHLYLATQAGGGGWGDCIRCIDDIGGMGSPIMPGPASGTSYLFDFELDGTAATHVASGEVEGSIADRWSVDEADGVLRVAVGPTSETGSFNSIITLQRQGKELVEHGRLDRLGVNEDIKSVRWFDDLAVLVTFRRVDPMYAIDLSDTAKPRLLGKLKVPGFSTYLHPLGSWRMIGLGEGPDGKGGWGAQIGLFDVRDVSRVKRLDVHSYGRSYRALADADPRAFTWLPDERTVITVLERTARTRVGYVSVVHLADGRLQQRLVQVEYGDDVDAVRAVPLPDGRVVLVTGDKAQFFELS